MPTFAGENSASDFAGPLGFTKPGPKRIDGGPCQLTSSPIPWRLPIVKAYQKYWSQRLVTETFLQYIHKQKFHFREGIIIQTFQPPGTWQHITSNTCLKHLTTMMATTKRTTTTTTAWSLTIPSKMGITWYDRWKSLGFLTKYFGIEKPLHRTYLQGSHLRPGAAPWGLWHGVPDRFRTVGGCAVGMCVTVMM